MNFVIIFVLIEAVCTSAKSHFEIHFTFGCFETGDTQVVLEVNGDEVFYADFNHHKGVFAYYPNHDYPTQKMIEAGYAVAERSRAVCPTHMYYGKCWSEPNVPKFKESPENAIYPRDEIELGSENTLICFITHFYPPSIDVTWTKNDVEVTGGVTLSRYYPNKDGTFHQISTLSFTPEEGDIYTCTVQHPALESPQTRIWEQEVNVPSAGPAVFCGVGVTLGLLGVAAGTFLLVKQPTVVTVVT